MPRPKNSSKYFASVDVLHAADDREWLSQATKALARYWHWQRNARKKSSQHLAPLDAQLKFTPEHTSPCNSFLSKTPICNKFFSEIRIYSPQMLIIRCNKIPLIGEYLCNRSIIPFDGVFRFGPQGSPVWQAQWTRETKTASSLIDTGRVIKSH